MKDNCSGCQYYYVTYDKSAPRGCKAYGFKTSGIPAQVVFNTSKMPCQSYEKKPIKSG